MCHFLQKTRPKDSEIPVFFVSLQSKISKDGKEKDSIYQSGNRSLRTRHPHVAHGKRHPTGHSGEGL